MVKFCPTVKGYESDSPSSKREDKTDASSSNPKTDTNSYGVTIREQFRLSTTISGGKMKDIVCIVG